MKDFLILLLIACTVALGYYLLHREDAPQTGHSNVTRAPINNDCPVGPEGITGTHRLCWGRDAPALRTPKPRDCDPSELTLECNGIRPR